MQESFTLERLDDRAVLRDDQIPTVDPTVIANALQFQQLLRKMISHQALNDPFSKGCERVVEKVISILLGCMEQVPNQRETQTSAPKIQFYNFSNSIFPQNDDIWIICEYRGIRNDAKPNFLVTFGTWRIPRYSISSQL